MTIQECYTQLGGDYNEILGRLRKDKTICRLALKFLNDESYVKIINSLKDNDYEAAFQGAHTLKGICQNLSFNKLYNTASTITETIRERKDDETAALLPQLTDDYNTTVQALKEFEAAYTP